MNRWNGGIGHFSGIQHMYDEVPDFPAENHEIQTLDRLRAMRDDDEVTMELSESTLIGDEDVTMGQ